MQQELALQWKQFTPPKGHTAASVIRVSIPKDPWLARQSEKAAGIECRGKLTALLGARSLQSISHVRNEEEVWVFGVGYAFEDQDSACGVCGVGIDLENTNRPVADSVRDRVTVPEERELGIGNLDIWTIKEATYKANPLNSRTVLRQYRIRSFNSEFHSGEVKTPWDLTFQFKTIRVRDWAVALAYGRTNVL